MNSFNHYSLGSCGEYLFGGIGGIRPASPGFKTILIEPVIRDGLSWAKTSYDSIHGRIATSWKREGHRLSLEVVIPANTTATISLPSSGLAGVTENGKPADKTKDLKFLHMDKENALFEVGSGTYKFVSEIGREAGQN